MIWNVVVPTDRRLRLLAERMETLLNWEGGMPNAAAIRAFVVLASCTVKIMRETTIRTTHRGGVQKESSCAPTTF